MRTIQEEVPMKGRKRKTELSVFTHRTYEKEQIVAGRMQVQTHHVFFLLVVSPHITQAGWFCEDFLQSVERQASTLN